MYIIGMNTGRCGSMSFAEFMNNQRHTTFTHEKAMDVTFYPMFQPYFRAMKTLRGYGGKYKGDISPAWAFWAAHVLKNHPKATKIVWIHRDIDEVAESFIKQKEKMLDAYKANFSGSDGFMGAYPVWEKEYSRDAIRRSVAKVFWLCKGMNTLYPDYVYPIHISSLNDENKQYELLSWLGYKDRDMRLGMPHLNRWEEVQVGNVYEGRLTL